MFWAIDLSFACMYSNSYHNVKFVLLVCVVSVNVGICC